MIWRATSPFLALALCFFLAGCPSHSTVGPADPGAGRQIARPVFSAPLSGTPAPWAPLAGALASAGLDARKLRAFFSSRELTFTPVPMETKLRELFPIFFRSDLTKAVQEKLFQLGYEVAIDGRNGPGTRKAIAAFARDRALSFKPDPSPELNARLDEALRAGRTRTLAEYAPPKAAPPNRTATHTQFTNASALAKIKAHYLADKALFDRAWRAYGVPGAVVCSIMWIETGYGSYFGKNKAAQQLASMAASSDYELIAPYVADLSAGREERAFLAETSLKRGAWARDELFALLKYAWENNLDPLAFPGSVYGAIGYGQFMPSNIAKYAADGDGDQIIDLFNKSDAVFSIANYLRQNGWTGAGIAEAGRREAIRRYNNSGVYVNTVLYVADYLSAAAP